MRAGIRALADEEMSATRNDAQRCAQPARVLERVVERQLHVFGSPEDQHRAAHCLELLTRVVRTQRLPRAVDVRVEQLRREKSLDSLVGQRAWIGAGAEPEAEPAEQERARDPD